MHEIARLNKKIMTWLFIVPLRLWSLMTLKMSQRIGWLIGNIVVLFDNNITQITKRNIELCFPNLSHRHKTRLIKNAVRQTCITGSEIPIILFKSPEKLLSNINLIYILDSMYIGYHFYCYVLEINFIKASF